MSRMDKSTSTPTTPTTPIPPNVSKLCHIIKREDFDGYGFNLHSEKIKPGQFIGKVDPNSPAEEAGLKEGDRIIEVNGVPIGSETHKQVVQRIKALSNEVRLLLIDVDGKGDDPKSPKKVTANTKCSSETDSCKKEKEAQEKEEEEKPALPKTLPPSPIPVISNGSNHGMEDNSSTEYHGTKLELPGESANISSISMISVKRMSSISSGSNHSSQMSNDVVDKAMPASPQSLRSQTETPEPIKMSMPMPMPDLTNGIVEKESKIAAHAMNNNNNMNTNNNNNNSFDKMMPPLAPIVEPVQKMNNNVPPPPSSVTASNNSNSNGSVPNANGNSMMSPPQASTTVPTPTASSPQSPGNGVIRAGSLNLPMTAAEMRAKLLSKKKYDPKQESVDLRKKFEIIQKL